MKEGVCRVLLTIPDKSKGAHSHGLQIRIPALLLTQLISRHFLIACTVPAGNLEGGAENLGTHELGHFGLRDGRSTSENAGQL
jgi:hypothetical protein